MATSLKVSEQRVDVVKVPADWPSPGLTHSNGGLSFLLPKNVPGVDSMRGLQRGHPNTGHGMGAQPRGEREENKTPILLLCQEATNRCPLWIFYSVPVGTCVCSHMHVCVCVCCVHVCVCRHVYMCMCGFSLTLQGQSHHSILPVRKRGQRSKVQPVSDSAWNETQEHRSKPHTLSSSHVFSILLMRLVRKD